LTRAGPVEGTLHLPSAHSLVDSLNHGHAFWTLTDVQVRNGANRIPFFALRMDSVLCAIPPVEENIPAKSVGGPIEDHDVMMLFESGTIAGKLSVTHGVRVSDFIAAHPGLIALRQCRLKLPEMPSEAPLVLVNTACLVGLTEHSHVATSG
jgi:hypothetical protein